MAIVEMVMPKMGESIMEGTVLSWLKSEGEEIEADESVLEVATDKVDTEVPATHGGILKEILVQEGDVVAVGAPIAKIETKAGAETENTPVESPAEPAKEPAAVNGKATDSVTETAPSNNGHAVTLDQPPATDSTSLVMNIAREERFQWLN